MFNDLIGVSYLSKGVGLNCWGLVRAGFEKFGIIVPNYDIASEAVDAVSCEPEATSNIIWEQRKKWQQLDKPEVPCLIAMSLDHPGFFHHLGLYIRNNQMLHTMRHRNSCIEKLDRPYFKNREKSFWKYVG